jgi:hypothetical protein
MHEPLGIAETKTLEPAKWEFERPNRSMAVTENNTCENVTASYNCGDFSMNSAITIYNYLCDEFGDPGLSTAVSAAASVPKGYLVDVNVTFQENYATSQVYLPSSECFELYYNLSITKCVRDGLLSGIEKSFFTLTGSNSPKQVSFWKSGYWVLRSSYNQTHLLEVNVQLTYYNGTVYKRVVQPFFLKIFPDSNNSFETAEEIGINQTRRAYIEYDCSYAGLQCYDTVDYYRIWLQNGTTTNFQLNYLDKAGIEMRVYNPDKQLEACLIYTVNETLCQLTVNINQTGWWYIKINAGSSMYIYTITVTTQEDS